MRPTVTYDPHLDPAKPFVLVTEVEDAGANRQLFCVLTRSDVRFLRLDIERAEQEDQEATVCAGYRHDMAPTQEQPLGLKPGEALYRCVHCPAETVINVARAESVPVAPITEEAAK